MESKMNARHRCLSLAQLISRFERLPRHSLFGETSNSCPAKQQSSTFLRIASSTTYGLPYASPAPRYETHHTPWLPDAVIILLRLATTNIPKPSL